MVTRKMVRIAFNGHAITEVCYGQQGTRNVYLMWPHNWSCLCGWTLAIRRHASCHAVISLKGKKTVDSAFVKWNNKRLCKILQPVRFSLMCTFCWMPPPPKKKKRNKDPKFVRHFMVICHIRLTSDEISFQGVLFSLWLHKRCLERPSLWKGTLDVFYARTACHSALSTTQNRSQIKENFTLRCCEIALRTFSANLAPNFSSKAACANARKLLKLCFRNSRRAFYFQLTTF